MATSENDNGKMRYPRLHKVAVYKLGEDRRFTLLPTGLYCNGQIAKAKSGERVRFTGGCGESEYVIKRMCRVAVYSPVFGFMCHSIYGHGSFGRLAEEWDALCEREGLMMAGSVDKPYSEKEVLLIELGKWDKDEYASEQKRKREIADALMRQAERNMGREELLELAKEGIYKHKDILE